VRCEDETGRCEDTIYASEAKRNATGARRPMMENWFDEAALPLWVGDGAAEVCEVGGRITDEVGVIMGVTEMLGVGRIELEMLTGTEELSGSMDGNVSVFNTVVALGVGLPSSGKVSVTLGSVSVGSGSAALEEMAVVVAAGA